MEGGEGMKICDACKKEIEPGWSVMVWGGEKRNISLDLCKPCYHIYSAGPIKFVAERITPKE
jgi:hypothetical protein